MGDELLSDLVDGEVAQLEDRVELGGALRGRQALRGEQSTGDLHVTLADQALEPSEVGRDDDPQIAQRSGVQADAALGLGAV